MIIRVLFTALIAGLLCGNSIIVNPMNLRHYTLQGFNVKSIDQKAYTKADVCVDPDGDGIGHNGSTEKSCANPTRILYHFRDGTIRAPLKTDPIFTHRIYDGVIISTKKISSQQRIRIISWYFMPDEKISSDTEDPKVHCDKKSPCITGWFRADSFPIYTGQSPTKGFINANGSFYEGVEVFIKIRPGAYDVALEKLDTESKNWDQVSEVIVQVL